MEGHSQNIFPKRSAGICAPTFDMLPPPVVCLHRSKKRKRCVAGNKNGNKRTANIRSVGYSDLFVLSKEDLWTALAEYPEARQKLLEKGRQVLRKDNLLDEEIASRQELDRLNPEEKLTRLESSLAEALDRLAEVNDSFNAVQKRLKQRITQAEKELKRELERTEPATVNTGGFLALPGQPLY